jgi:hypothetical protein
MSSILAHKHMHKHPVSASDFKILSSGTAECMGSSYPWKPINFRNLTLSLMLILDLPLLSYFSYVVLTLTILTMHLTLIFSY